MVKELIGKKKLSKELGLVLVKGLKEGSRTILEVEVLDKGVGFDKQTNSFKGLTTKTPSGHNWRRGQNREYKTIHEVHYKSLK